MRSKSLYSRYGTSASTKVKIWATYSQCTWSELSWESQRHLLNVSSWHFNFLNSDSDNGHCIRCFFALLVFVDLVQRLSKGKIRSNFCLTERYATILQNELFIKCLFIPSNFQNLSTASILFKFRIVFKSL